MPRPLPVIVVSGFLGAGKTSLLHHFVSEYQGGAIALLIEDCGEPILDAKAMRGLCGAMRRSRDAVVEIPTSSPDAKWLSQTLDSLAAEDRFDLALVEISGTKTVSDFNFSSLNSGSTQIQKIVCVIDALDFFRALSPPGASPEFPTLQRAQIEEADLLVLNKCDLLQSPERDACVKTLLSINLHAQIIETAYGEISPDLWTQSLSAKNQKPAKSTASQATNPPASQFESISYRAHRPFHPARFWDWFNAEHPGLLRAKGIVWLATRNLLVGGISRTRHQNSCGGAGIWWAALPREEWPDEPEALLRMQETWQEPFGDRRQELILVGAPAALAQLTPQLDSCLLIDEEYALPPNEWLAFPDPFPAWEIGEN
jgi:G3E family GTPase